MANFADLLKKIANNSRLTPQELDELGRFGTETQQRNSFVAGNTTPQNTLNIPFPFFPIYSEVFNTDVANVSIDIPQDYKHLFIIGSGRTTDTGGSQYVSVVFNSDTGNNYSCELMQRANTTQSGSQTLSLAYAPLGFFLDDTLATDQASSFFSIIPHYQSQKYKTVITLGNYRNPSFRYALIQSSFWDSTAKIQNITFKSSAGNLKAGSVISVYGIF
jgi:hypothetical protein